MTYHTRVRHDETAEDLANERRMAEVYARYVGTGGMELVKLEKYAVHDFKLYSPLGIYALIECKMCNNISRDMYVYHLFMRKFEKMQSEGLLHDALSVLVCQFYDGYFMCEVSALKRENLKAHVWGREDRGDPMDKQQSVIIPMNKFRYISPL